MNVPRSKEFDDVYFSAEDGLAETRHVFLLGNNLPESWMEQDCFTICETGFGTGLNFLAALKMWNDCPKDRRPARLRFISFEKFPLNRDFIEAHLSRWSEVSGELATLLSVYPDDMVGGKRDLLIGDDVELSLIFGDVNVEIPKLEGVVDCWFLDGFKPSSNADMWSDTVFENMSRLSHVGTSFATFTSAGFVRRGLKSVGFDVQKIAGFGRKREMSVGVYQGGDDAG